MNILLVSYHSLDYDGRLNELVKVANICGKLYLMSLKSERQIEFNYIIENDKYFKYIKQAISKAEQLPHIDLLIIDGRKAIIPAMWIARKYNIGKIALDCREMDFPEYTTHFSGKIGCYIEKLCIKKADIIIAANKERADVMQVRYNLKKQPLVFENIRTLEYDDAFDQNQAKEKFKALIRTDSYRVISSAGCFLDRMTDILVENFDKVQYKADLLLVGTAIEKEKKIIEEIINRKGYKNVHIVGKVTQSELKYLIRNCHVGIVAYHQRTPNYKYCASGKIYEYIFEEIPVVTTTNPSLLSICRETGIGVSDDCFYSGINSILEKYDVYQYNVKNLLKTDLFERNINSLATKIMEMAD